MKEHPEFEYCDVSCVCVEEKRCDIRVYIFFGSISKEKYAYNSNGHVIKKVKNKNNQYAFLVADTDKYRCYLKYDDNALNGFSISSVNNFPIDEFRKKIKFNSEKQDIEYYIKNGLDKNGNLYDAMLLIEERINDRNKPIIIK